MPNDSVRYYPNGETAERGLKSQGNQPTHYIGPQTQNDHSLNEPHNIVHTKRVLTTRRSYLDYNSQKTKFILSLSRT